MAWDDKFNAWYNQVIPDTTNLLSWIEPRKAHWQAWHAHRYWVIPASIVPSMLIGAMLRMRYAEDPDRTFGVFLIIFLVAVPCISLLFYLYCSLIASIPRGVVVCPDHLIVGVGRGVARYYYRAIDLAQLIEIDGQSALDVHFKSKR